MIGNHMHKCAECARLLEENRLLWLGIKWIAEKTMDPEIMNLAEEKLRQVPEPLSIVDDDT